MNFRVRGLPERAAHGQVGREQPIDQRLADELHRRLAAVNRAIGE